MAATGSAERTPRSVSAAELPLRLVEMESMPLYLQIVHQVKQLIMTGELADRVQLPVVRSLAEHLGINPGTVVRAYRQLADEGLIETRRGRGSVVRSLSGRTQDTVSRERLLDAAIRRLTARSRALGFDGPEALERVSAALLNGQEPAPVAFLGQIAEQAARFAGELTARYEPDDVVFRPLGMDEVKADGGERLRSELEASYTVLTFAPLVPDLEGLLDRLEVQAEVVGVRAQMTASSLDRLRRLSERGRCGVATSVHAVSTVLAKVEDQAGIYRSDVRVVGHLADGTLDSGELQSVAEDDLTIVFTSGVRADVERLELPADRLAELGFELTPATLCKLDDRWPLRQPGAVR